MTAAAAAYLGQRAGSAVGNGMSREGGASVLDFLDAERTYRATQLGYHQQLAAYLVALAQLRSAAGLDIAP